jgi:hypothetical protein
MRRAPFVVAALLLALCPASPAAAQERPPLRASLAACESGAGPAARFAVFTGSMPALAGTQRMSMRFDLMERPDRARRWRRVRAPAFGRWDRSRVAGAAGFIYTKRVERLKEGARYRAVVRFRWLDRRGRVQRSARRTTAVCSQPFQRPNLAVEAVAIAPGPDAATYRYLVTVVNGGRTAASPSRLGLVTDAGDAVREVPALPPGGRTTVELVQRRCTEGSRLQVTLDLDRAVGESDEGDNASSWPCTGR